MEFALTPEFWLVVGQIMMLDILLGGMLLGSIFVLCMGKWLALQQSRDGAER